MDYKNKKVLVCGIARSGIAAAFMLKKLGASVTVSDNKNADEIEIVGGLLELQNAGIKIIFGKNPDSDMLNDAEIIVLSPGIPSDTPFVLEAKQKGVKVISEIELAYSVCKAPVIAITGTNGKTTTTALTAEIFRSVYKKTEALGNIGNAFCSKALELTAEDYAVVEVSSFQLENIMDFKPKAGVVLNITPDHLDRHKTLDEYVKMKERIFENQDDNDFLILNSDDPICEIMAAKSKSKIIYFSQKKENIRGVYLKNNSIISNINGEHEIITGTGELKVVGRHLLEDVLACVATARCFGISVKNIADVLHSFNGVTHRLEYVAEINGVKFYNDSKATNPDAAIQGLTAMERPTVLICGGYDKNSDFSEWTALFNKKVKYAVMIGATADKIINSCESFDFYSYEKADSLEEAVKKCFAAAEPGDAVLLSPACASWGMFKDFEERGNKFKENIFKLKAV